MPLAGPLKPESVTSAYRTGPHALYHDLCEKGDIQPDPGQDAAIAALQQLYEQLIASQPVAKPWWQYFMPNRAAQNGPAGRGGVYIYGSVGRGKSMLMDIFFNAVPFAEKRRLHFHEFMRETHDGLNQWRKSPAAKKGKENPLTMMAQDFRAKIRLLCFDEFMVSDIADAMIMRGLFEALLDLGVVVVATSNDAPDRLYWDGLQRRRFLPFIDFLKEKLEVVYLDSPTDYRREKPQSQDKSGSLSPYLVTGNEPTDYLGQVFAALGCAQTEPFDIPVKGRVLHVPHWGEDNKGGKIAGFTFAQLCEAPLGTLDYLALGEQATHIIIQDIPFFDRIRLQPGRRFIMLIDTLYDLHRQVYISAVAPPDQLGQDHKLFPAFERTISRLIEMQSPDYKTDISD